jgi:heme/copper-type cytochrome/quinol oxidase subunit 4
MAAKTDSFVERREGDFWVNAFIGAVVMVVLSWIPFATVLGGGVAGYLQRGSRMGGATVGAVSGLIAAIPVFGVLGLVFGGIGLGAIAGGEALGFVVFATVMLFALVLTAVVVAGTGAVGGYVGVYLRERTDGDDYDDHGPAADPTTEIDPETAP